MRETAQFIELGDMTDAAADSKNFVVKGLDGDVEGLGEVKDLFDEDEIF